jgi:histidinol dehydrogenase
VLGLLDLRERGEQLEPSRFESDPTVTETVRGILQRVRDEGDPVLIELARRFDGADLSTVIVSDDEFDRAEADTPRTSARRSTR